MAILWLPLEILATATILRPLIVGPPHSLLSILVLKQSASLKHMHAAWKEHGSLFSIINPPFFDSVLPPKKIPRSGERGIFLKNNFPLGKLSQDNQEFIFCKFIFSHY